MLKHHVLLWWRIHDYVLRNCVMKLTEINMREDTFWRKSLWCYDDSLAVNNKNHEYLILWHNVKKYVITHMVHYTPHTKISTLKFQNVLFWKIIFTQNKMRFFPWIWVWSSGRNQGNAYPDLSSKFWVKSRHAYPDLSLKFWMNSRHAYPDLSLKFWIKPWHAYSDLSLKFWIKLRHAYPDLSLKVRLKPRHVYPEHCECYSWREHCSLWRTSLY